MQVQGIGLLKNLSRCPVDVARVPNFLSPHPVVLVTSAFGARENVAVVPWYTMVNERPPKIVLSVGLKSLTYELIARSNQFGINVPTLSAHPDHISLETIIKCSNDIATDRKENDQFGVLGLTKLPATFFGMKVPLIGECVAHVECSVIGKTDEIGDHVVFWGTVLAASAVEGCLDQEGYFSSLLTFPILQDLGRGHFSSICGWMEFEKK